MTDLVFTPAYQLAQMIRARQVCAVEVLEAHLAQINKHIGEWHAFGERSRLELPLPKSVCSTSAALPVSFREMPRWDQKKQKGLKVACRATSSHLRLSSDNKRGDSFM